MQSTTRSTHPTPVSHLPSHSYTQPISASAYKINAMTTPTPHHPLRIRDIPTHRLTPHSTPLALTDAPVTSSALFKSEYARSKPALPATRREYLSGLLNQEARSRIPSSLKVSGASLTDDVISLSTGRPSARYFPFEALRAGFVDAQKPFGCDAAGKTLAQQVGKYDSRFYSPGAKTCTGSPSVATMPEMDLAIALNYGYSAGSEQLVRFLTEHVEITHDPPYAEWETCLTIGSTSALDLAFRTLCERGDNVLVEAYTYSGTIECAMPLGLGLVPVAMDAEGLSAEALRKVLEEWDESRRGRRPRLLYTIPTGQNPTGLTQTEERRREVYAVAEDWDLFIIEDDPYYFLQFEEEGGLKSQENGRSEEEGYLRGLAPSYLKLDTSGRVLRLDSTSKILAPGLRCGWMTGPAQIIKAFLLLHDFSVVCPSGLSQLVMYQLLEQTWGHQGFATWLDSLRNDYAERKRAIVKACEKYLPKEVCSWHAPSAGMFLWLRVDWKSHPLVANSRGLAKAFEIEDRVYDAALERGVLCCKGSCFSAGSQPDTEIFFRTTFATASTQQLEEGIRRFAMALEEEFALKP